MANGPEDEDDLLAPSDETTNEDGSVTFDLPEEESDVIEHDDGSATIDLEPELDPEAEQAEQVEFYANLVEALDPKALNDIGTSLIELIDQDREDRRERDELYAEGLKRTGMGKDIPKPAFPTGSEAIYPILTEVSIDFASKAIKELMPVNGPVRDKILGVPTKGKIEKARRKVRYLNYVLTEKMPEFRSDLEAVLSQLPLGGSQGIKFYFDHGMNRLRCEPVYVDNLLIPGSATSWSSAERKTHVQKLSGQEFQKRIDDNVYIVAAENDVQVTGSEPEKTSAELAAESIEATSTDSLNLDGLRTVYETACYLDLSEYGIDADEGPRLKPYLVTIDEQNRSVLAIYRNWKKDDPTFREMQHIVQFRFVPWRGAYGIGLMQMIGGLAVAATGALRALLDSAMVQTIPSGLRLAGTGKGGQTLRPQPGEFAEIQGAIDPSQDDIRKRVMAYPFNPPSPVLLTLLGTLSDTAKGVVATALENIPDNPANMPVGTTQALIEQGLTVFSAIHARLHDSFGQCLKIIHRLLEQWLDEDTIVDDTGELLVRAEDFHGAMDVIPVSDPNVFSEQQRFAQIQAVITRSDMTGLYDRRKVEEIFLERLKIPNGKDLLLPAQTPQRLNAVNENVAATMRRPVVAFPDQDHEAHIRVHLAFALSKTLGMNPLIAMHALPMLLNHLKEHIAFFYAIATSELVEALTGVEANELMKNDGDDDDYNERKNQEFDRLLADMTPQVMGRVEQAIAKYMPYIQVLQERVQAMQPQQMPVDPLVQVQQAEVQRKTQADQIEAAGKAEDRQLKRLELQQEAQQDAAQEQGETQRAQLAAEQAMERTLLEEQGDTQRNSQDNETAMTIAAQEIASGERSALSTGTGINPAP